MKGKRRLKRSSNRIFTGVLGGIADYFGIDATLIRIIFVVLTIFPGHVVFGLLIYLLLTVLIHDDVDTQRSSFFGGFGSPKTDQSTRKELHDVTEEDSDKK